MNMLMEGSILALGHESGMRMRFRAKCGRAVTRAWGCSQERITCGNGTITRSLAKKRAHRGRRSLVQRLLRPTTMNGAQIPDKPLRLCHASGRRYNWAERYCA